MVRNDYSGVLEPWKVELAVARARQMGFCRERLDDALQELVPLLARFKRDPAKSNGGTESTALSVVIIRRLSNIIRQEQRQKKREERCPPPPVSRDDTRETEMACDVRLVLEQMPPQDRQVCEALGQGKSQAEIAEALGVSRDVVRWRMERIRRRFVELGLENWLGDLPEQKEEQP